MIESETDIVMMGELDVDGISLSLLMHHTSLRGLGYGPSRYGNLREIFDDRG